MRDRKCFPRVIIAALCLAAFAQAAQAARAPIAERKGEPYLGAVVVDADTGDVLFEENSEVTCYPASIIKLMMLLIIQEKIEEGALSLDEKVTATAEAAGMGGSQVYLAENEVFTIEDLLYALLIQSANDAAVALAVHVAGSKEAFVEMMQGKAEELGMKNTEFHSVHGLPPSVGEKPDVSSPRDLAVLSREVLKHPDVLKYTSTVVRTFRENPPFEMRSHNKLLGSFEGCNGLKTGYFRAGGYSIAASAERGGHRVVAVVAGAKDKGTRNEKARELLARGFSEKRSGALSGTRPAGNSVPVKQGQALASASGPSGEEEDDDDPGAAHESDRSGVPVLPIVLGILFPVVAVAFFVLGRLSAGGARASSRYFLK